MATQERPASPHSRGLRGHTGQAKGPGPGPRDLSQGPGPETLAWDLGPAPGPARDPGPQGPHGPKGPGVRGPRAFGPLQWGLGVEPPSLQLGLGCPWGGAPRGLLGGGDGRGGSYQHQQQLGLDLNLVTLSFLKGISLV